MLLSDLGSDALEAVTRRLAPCEVASLMLTCKSLAAAAEPKCSAWVALRAAVQKDECWYTACRELAKGGHLQALVWADAEYKYYFDWETCVAAAEGGRLEVLQWLYGLGPADSSPRPYDWELEFMFAAAAEGGHLEVLQWLCTQTPPHPREERLICQHAAHSGHLEILQWCAQEPEWSWDGETCSQAAAGGQLEVLQWLRGKTPPCPWFEWPICQYAAEGGHLAVLRRAREQSCPWDERTCQLAAEGGHLEVLKYVRAQSPPCP